MEGKKLDLKAVFSKIKQLLADAVSTDAPAVETTTEYVLEDGTKVTVDKLETGGKMTVNGTAIADGDRKMQDGTIVTTKDGDITNVVAPANEDPKDIDPEEMRKRKEAAMAAATQFDEATPEDKMSKLGVMCKALMEYCFGWDINRVNQEALKNQAIQIYKEAGFSKDTIPQQFSDKFAEMNTKLEAYEKKMNAQAEELKKCQAQMTKHQEALSQLFEVVQKMATEPVESPADKNTKNQFTSQKAITKEERLEAIAETVNSLRKEAKKEA